MKHFRDETSPTIIAHFDVASRDRIPSACEAEAITMRDVNDKYNNRSNKTDG